VCLLAALRAAPAAARLPRRRLGPQVRRGQAPGEGLGPCACVRACVRVRACVCVRACACAPPLTCRPLGRAARRPACPSRAARGRRAAGRRSPCGAAGSSGPSGLGVQGGGFSEVLLEPARLAPGQREGWACGAPACGIGSPADGARPGGPGRRPTGGSSRQPGGPRPPPPPRAAWPGAWMRGGAPGGRAGRRARAAAGGSRHRGRGAAGLFSRGRQTLSPGGTAAPASSGQPDQTYYCRARLPLVQSPFQPQRLLGHSCDATRTLPLPAGRAEQLRAERARNAQHAAAPLARNATAARKEGEAQSRPGNRGPPSARGWPARSGGDHPAPAAVGVGAA
jgi:hypothetical protein